MSFRNALEAFRARAEASEEENERLRAELVALRGSVETTDDLERPPGATAQEENEALRRDRDALWHELEYLRNLHRLQARAGQPERRGVAARSGRELLVVLGISLGLLVGGWAVWFAYALLVSRL